MALVVLAALRRVKEVVLLAVTEQILFLALLLQQVAVAAALAELEDK